jgi:acyl-coenzyme A thioesterase PaaI-like protein
MMTESDHYRKLEDMMHSSPVMQWTGGRVAITKGEARLTLTVRSHFFTPQAPCMGHSIFLPWTTQRFLRSIPWSKMSWY